MNAPDDLELQLRGWMRHRAPLSPHADLVDGVVSRTATVRQRPGVFVRSGGGAGSLSPAALLGGRRAILLFGAVLALLAMAAAFVGSRPSAEGDPLLVRASGLTYRIALDRTVERVPWSVTSSRGSADLDACPHLVPGTDVVAYGTRFPFAFGFTSLGQPFAPIAGVSLDFGGTQFWSTDGKQLLLLETGASVTLVDLADPFRQETRRFPLPGVVGADVTPDGGRLVVALVSRDGVELQAIDTSTAERRTAARLPTSIAEPGTVPLLVSPDGSRVALGAVNTPPSDSPTEDVLVVDLATGATTTIIAGVPWSGIAHLDAAWSPDGSRLAMTTGTGGLAIAGAAGGSPVTVAAADPSGLRWSPDGSRLAFLDGTSLVTVAPDGAARVERPVGSAGFLWEPSGTSLVVASNLGAPGIAIERYGVGDVAPRERLALIGPEGTIAVSPQRAPPCLDWFMTSRAP
jgi:hypothetical protein